MDQEQRSRHESFEKLRPEIIPDSDIEFFSDPEARLQFLESLTWDDFKDILTHVNGRMRGIEPREHTLDGANSILPMQSVADSRDKEDVLKNCYSKINEFLTSSQELPEDERLLRASLAVEAAIIYVHPFADGNGRTARFFGEFIENGTRDIESVKNKTASSKEKERPRTIGSLVHRYKTSGNTIALPLYDPLSISRFDKDSPPKFPASPENQPKLLKLLNSESIDEVITAALDEHCDLGDPKFERDEFGDIRFADIVKYMDDDFVDTLDNKLRTFKNHIAIATVRGCLSDDQFCQQFREKILARQKKHEEAVARHKARSKTVA